MANLKFKPGQYTIKPASMRDVHTIRRLELIVFPKDAYSYLNLSALLMWAGAANFKALASDGTLIGFVSGTPNWGSPNPI